MDRSPIQRLRIRWMVTRGVLGCLALTVGPFGLRAQDRLPIIDTHVHALPATAFGPPPARVCVGSQFPWVDPKEDITDAFHCERPLLAPTSDEEIMRGTLAVMTEHNVYGLTSGPPPLLRRWVAADPTRIRGSASTNWQDASQIDSIRARVERGEVFAMGEVTAQYLGGNPSDPRYEPFWSLAEELDLPISIHVGLGPPGAAYIGSPGYRMALSDPTLLEEALLRHPTVRVNVMHAGWPNLDRMIGILFAHPQVNVDLGIISYGLPRAELHRYLKGLVDAGFGKRIMFGSDQMIWPEALAAAIGNVESANFLTAEQKRDIFYGNAARFLRWDPAGVLAGR